MTERKKTYEELRSARWMAPDDFRSFGHRSRTMQMGYAPEDWEGRPVIAILTGLGLFVGMAHFRKGAQMMIEDYWKKSTKKVLIISVIVLSYGLTAFGLFALAKIAL